MFSARHFAVAWIFVWLLGPTVAASQNPTNPFTLSPVQIARLHQALATTHSQYDPAERMIRKPFSSPGYHTTLKGGYVHPTRDSLNYAVALLDTGDPDWLKRAAEILRRVIALQDQNPDSKTYGIWSWFLEEPLDKMSPPDWNWADFCGVQLLQVARDHRSRLPADLMAQVDAAVLCAARSIQRRDVKPTYTNIAIMGAYVTLVAAELYHLEDLQNYAMARLRNFYDHTMRNGAFTEYNSPTYTVVALTELGRMRQHAREPEARRLIEPIYRLAWEEIARHFHPPTRQWAGPHSRCYQTLLSTNSLALIQTSTEGRVPFFSKEPTPTLASYRVPVPCPRDLERFFTSLDEPREVVETFVKSSPPLVGTTCLTPAFALGSINRGDFWNQRRPLLAYWGDAKQPAYLQVRFLHDGYDFADAQFFSVQKDGTVLAGVNFGTDGGDTHTSLDRIKDGRIHAKDLRLRFEFGGAAGKNTPLAPVLLTQAAGLRFGKLNLVLCVPFAMFDGAQGRWEAGSDDQKQIAWLDVVLYSGAAKEINFAELQQAAVGFSTRFATGKPTPLEARAAVKDGRLNLAMEQPPLQLNLPVRPDKVSELQKDFSASVRP